MKKLPEIPSDFIEPYLVDFLGRMVEFIATSKLTNEEKVNKVGWTVSEMKQRIKGVELFVSFYCGIHARYAMMNAFQDHFEKIPDDELREICKKVMEQNLWET